MIRNGEPESAHGLRMGPQRGFSDNRILRYGYCLVSYVTNVVRLIGLHCIVCVCVCAVPNIVQRNNVEEKSLVH